MHTKSTLLIIALVASSFAIQAEARPYFYYQAAEPAPAETAVESIQQDAQSAGKQVSEQAKKLAEQLGQHARQTQNYVQGALNSPEAQGISGHLGSLYNHGSTAIRTVMETVRPDLSNLGHDVSDIYAKTRDNISTRITPIGQTIKPYIDNAQKAVAPYLNQAKEEVPKLIEKAGPTLNKAKEQIASVWGKVSNSVSNAASQVSSQVQQAAQTASESAPVGPAPESASAANPSS